ncbi:MAG: hypothetical protein JWM95_3077 [Gemmatimonadetes bacterium]|nr:hypothetical protein [Gemmatimonadota bacterium]
MLRRNDRLQRSCGMTICRNGWRRCSRASLLFADKIGAGHSMTIGYTIIVASFLLVYFGIRSYRDNTLHGQISFGRAFACGLLITLISAALLHHKAPTPGNASADRALA